MNYTRYTLIAFLMFIQFITVENVFAQEGPTEKYAEEYGTYTKYYQKLTFYYDKDVLKAKMEIEKEKRLIDENFASAFSTESVFHSYFSTLAHISAATLVPTNKGFKSINTDNFKVKPAKEDFVFFDDAKQTEVSFNNLQKGNRTSIKYQMDFRDANMLPKIFLQSYLPIEHLKVQVVMPKGLVLVDSILGFDPINISRNVTGSKQTTTITWEAYDVPKLKVYADAPSVSYYIKHLMLRVRSGQNPRTGETERYLGDTDDLNGYMYRYVRGINKVPGQGIQEKVKELVAPHDTEDAKAKAIYKWVQEHIRYVAFEDSLGGFVPREANLVFERRFGDCKDMTSLLKVMCEQAGLEARYVWIGTRDIPYKVAQFPIPGAFNHMIAAVRIDKVWKFLDGTDNVIPYGAVPYSLQGKDAFISKDATNYEIVAIPFSRSDAARLSDSSNISIDNSDLNGNVHIDLSGYKAWELNSLLKYKSRTDMEKTFQSITQRGNNKYDQGAFKHLQDNDEAKSIHIDAHFELRDYVRKLDGHYYVNMHLNKPFQEGKVDIEKRNVPVHLNYRTDLVYTVVLDIPEGYKVNYLPEGIDHNFRDVGNIKVSYEVKNDKVLLKKVLKFDNVMIEVEAFEEYNKMISQLQKAYKESVELTKITQ